MAAVNPKSIGWYAGIIYALGIHQKKDECAAGMLLVRHEISAHFPFRSKTSCTT